MDLRHVSEIISKAGGNIVTVNCESRSAKGFCEEIVLAMTVETRGEEHLRAILKAIVEAGYAVRTGPVTL
jgi:ACT domain-containing protein